MTEPEWRVRVAGASDRLLLAEFTCANRALPWTIEVEAFIRTELLDWAHAPGAADDDPRILLVFERMSNDLVGVAAHERAFLGVSATQKFAATKLCVVAVCSAWQGRRFASGERASDVVMSAALTDVSARVPPRDARVYAVIHKNNAKSIALCKRHGLTHHLSSPAANYLRLVTEHLSR
jgi:hypothetical protein